ncbi:MAG TPA: hypothetical protein PLR06_06310 [Cyclobacteriaceae bacterium]|nr:hypothetical protein [Cyclobacteriaceae bacterium]
MNQWILFCVKIIIVLMMIIALPETAAAQNRIREKIDQERAEENLANTDPKVLERARKYIREDSSYYVGYLMQGAYLYFRANDELGFKQVITPLKKALRLMEKDFDRQLRTRSNSYPIYAAVFKYHREYGLIAYLLQSSYQNIEMPDKALEILLHVRDRNFQLEAGTDSYNTIAWIYHRNRVYTSKQYSFLKNSVKANTAVADRYLDSALYKLQNDNSLNMGLFDPNFLNRQYLSTYHYKAMIMDYKLEIDSANYFYDVLIMNDAYSSNNYAEFKLAMGELAEADEFFKEAEKKEYSSEKRTKEYFYMQGMLNIYRGHPELADTLLRKILDLQGATPGYGWHTIGLARALHYEGLTDESQWRNNKAARFQELHIGTTWGQEQYNLAVASLNYINQLQLKKEYFFENDQWWFWLNPYNWFEWIRFSLEIHHHKLVLASLVAKNPEREQVIYTIFSSENLMSFDEVWSVIDGFGNEYFIDIYENLLRTDKRPQLKKYFRYFLGKLYLAEGEATQATEYFEQVIKEIDRTDAYQTLLSARVFEGLAHAASNESDKQKWITRLYDEYPQLVPFSGLEMKFNLIVSGDVSSDQAEDVLGAMKNCNLDFTNNEADVPTANLRFSETKDALLIDYSVTSGIEVRQRGILRVAKGDSEGGKLLAYRLFGINKEKVSEKPAAVKVPDKAPV